MRSSSASTNFWTASAGAPLRISEAASLLSVDLRCVRLRHTGFVHDLLPKYLSIGSVG
jgi:hypothetical protein